MIQRRAKSFKAVTMMWLWIISLTAVAYAAPQVGGGAGQTGEGTLGNTAMLRFGCAQAVIDRIDPYVTRAVSFSSSENKETN